MSGLLVLFACLAVAVAIAIPTVARAAAPTNNPANTMMRKAGGEQEEFITITGNIYIKGSSLFHKDKWMPTDLCEKLVVFAHKGSDTSGPPVGKTNAMPGKDPGSCVYSLKVPGDQNVTVGVQSVSCGASKLSASQYGKLSQQDKISWKWQKVADDWSKVGLNGDGFPAAVGKEYSKDAKFKGSVNMPLFIKLMPGQ